MSKRYLLISLVASILFVASTLFLFPVSITHVDQLANIRLGKPFPFITQDHSHRIFWDLIDVKVSIKNPLETPTTFLFGNFLLSVAIVFIALCGLLKGVTLLFRR